MPFSTDFVPPMRTASRRLSRYLLALGLVAVATLLRLALDPLLGHEMPFVMYFGAAVVAAWFGGLEGGLLALLASAVAGNYFLAPPRLDLSLTARDVTKMVVFCGISLFLVLFTARWRRAEQELRRLHEQSAAHAKELEAILDAVPAAVFVTRDAQATRMEGNRLAAEYLAVEPGTNLSKTAPPEERPATFRALKDGVDIPGEELPVQRAIAQGAEVRDYEFDLAYSDGRVRSLFGNAVPLRDEQGRVRGAVGAFVDITAQKQIRETIRQSEERFRSVVDGSRDVVYRLNLDTRQFEYVSPSAETVVGYSAEELIALGLDGALGLIHQDDVSAMTAVAASLPNTGTGQVEYRHRTKAGAYRWVSHQMWLVRDGAGRPVYRDGNIRDVTPRKELEHAVHKTVRELEDRVRQLSESESRYRTMGETLPYGVWLTDPQGRALYTSQSFLDLLNMSMEEMQQFGWTQRLVPEDVEPMLNKWFHCIETGDMWDHEHRILDRNGEIRTVLTRGLPVRDEHGVVTSWVGVNLDITDRKRLEEQFREQAEALGRANRMKDEFLATLSHELRTPLNAIVGWSDMLRRGRLNPNDTQRATDSIYRNAQAQTEMIADVLDVSRIISGKVQIEPSPMDLPALLQNAMDSLRAAASTKNVQLLSEIASVPYPVSGDATRMQQVFWNLLSNAVKFTPAGGTVRVSLHVAHGQVEVMVSDTGIGIPREFLPHVFERFRQRDSSSTRTHGGLGLGLAIVKHLVELHGGTVTAESAGEGQGATFTVRLPAVPFEDRRREEHRAVRNVPPVETFPDDVPPLCGTRVLVVDDHSDARDLSASVLRNHGATVAIAASAMQALDQFVLFDPHVLLVDLAMPEMDGFALLERIRMSEGGKGQRVPAIAFTAYAREEDRRRTLANGFQLHIAKPVDAHTLVRAVDSVRPRPR